MPAFELGRKAGLGQPITPDDEARLALAWTGTSTAVELPVYYSWTFATGAGGDFRSLALLLRARPLPDGTGTLAVDVAHSGLVADIPEGTRFPVAGALQPVGATPAGWSSPQLADTWESALAPVLNAPAVATGDPVLAPTLYGAGQAGLDEVDRTGHGTRWFEQLNLSPAYRAVAHLGTRVVQDLQDQLMASAWAQAADLQRAHQQLRRTELGDRLAASLHARHLAPMAAQAGLLVLAPAQLRMTRAGGAYAAALFATLLGPTAFAPALRRIARPLGAINRRFQRGIVGLAREAPLAPVARTTSMLARLQPNATLVRFAAVVAPPGEVTLQRVSAALNPPQTLFTWTGCNPDAVTIALQNDVFAFVPFGQRVPVMPNDRRRHSHAHPPGVHGWLRHLRCRGGNLRPQRQRGHHRPRRRRSTGGADPALLHTARFRNAADPGDFPQLQQHRPGRRRHRPTGAPDQVHLRPARQPGHHHRRQRRRHPHHLRHQR